MITSRSHRRNNLPPKSIWGLLLTLLASLSLAACGAVQTAAPLPTLAPTAIALPTAAPAPTAVPTAPAGLWVNAGIDLGPISPYVYGTNYGPWSAVPFEMLDAAYQAHITHLRFPGGAWGDSINLTHRQIDEYIALCTKMGAEPNIAVRLRDGTPEVAVEILRYTIEKGYNVKYWTVGNEPSLYANAERGIEYDTVQFNREWRAIAEALKAEDPNILLIGPEVHQITGDPARNPKDSAGRDWMVEFLKANGNLVDIVSLHRYPFPSSNSAPPPTIDDLRQNPPEWEQTIPYVRGIIKEITGRDLPIAVTEINSNWAKPAGGEATPDSFYNAIWLTDVLGRLIRQDVVIVNHFVLSTSGNMGPWGLVSRSGPRPSYYVYQMYSHFGQQLVQAESDDENVSIYASTPRKRRADPPGDKLRPE